MTAPPIPEAALPVAEILRRDVPRPKTLPIMTTLFRTTEALRWIPKGGVAGVCPMGRHQDARSLAPTCAAGFPFPTVRDAHVEAFGDWWDSLTLEQAPAAMDAIWGAGND